ncbi:hypothetical protein QTN25_007825 [Entamoeba marina]
MIKEEMLRQTNENTKAKEETQRENREINDKVRKELKEYMNLLVYKSKLEINKYIKEITSGLEKSINNVESKTDNNYNGLINGMQKYIEQNYKEIDSDYNYKLNYLDNGKGEMLKELVGFKEGTVGEFGIYRQILGALCEKISEHDSNFRIIRQVSNGQPMMQIAAQQQSAIPQIECDESQN